MSSWDLYRDKKVFVKPGVQQSFDFEFLANDKAKNDFEPKVSRSDNVNQASKIVQEEIFQKKKAPKNTVTEKKVRHSSRRNTKKRNTYSHNPDIESVLPYSAWPVGELSEIRSKKEENVFHLLLPLLSELSSQNRWITLISPPLDIDKKLFAYHGIDVSRVLLIHPKDSIDDTCTMNKALKNGTSGIVIMWAEKLPKRFVAQWRKSVKQGNCRGIIVNHDPVDHHSPSIALSLNVEATNSSITITSTQRFGRKTHYKAKRSFPIVSFDDIAFNRKQENSLPFCLIN